MLVSLSPATKVVVSHGLVGCRRAAARIPEPGLVRRAMSSRRTGVIRIEVEIVLELALATLRDVRPPASPYLRTLLDARPQRSRKVEILPMLALMLPCAAICCCISKTVMSGVCSTKPSNSGLGFVRLAGRVFTKFSRSSAVGTGSLIPGSIW